jgi:predicted RNA binding protein YcfA (HicA-like mRNA interferase family)
VGGFFIGQKWGSSAILTFEVSLPKVPRNVRQAQAIRAFVRFGGTERTGKGSHRVVKMENGHVVSLPSGIIKAGLLESEIKRAGMTVEQFIDLL